MNETQKRYNDAIDSFVGRIKTDPNVIAVIVAGSVTQGHVWEKSDIDMTVVVRDQKLEHRSYGINEDNILINVDLIERSKLKRGMERNLEGSIMHSFTVTSKVVFSKDEGLYDYFEENKRVGQADMERSLFNRVNSVLYYVEKIEKWLVTKKDETYARYYVLKAADAIAQTEVCAHCLVPTREAILQAAELNPALMEKFYTQPMNGAMSEVEIRALLDEMDAYIKTHMEAIVSVATEFFGDGEIKTGTHISKYFRSSLHEMHPILDFLCDNGIIDKISQTIRITPNSKLAVEEMAFIMPQP